MSWIDDHEALLLWGLGLALTAMLIASRTYGSEPGSIGTLDSGSRRVRVTDVMECKDGPIINQPCTVDDDCDVGCTGAGTPAACCEAGTDTGSCVCETRAVESIHLVPATVPQRQTVTCSGAVQQVFSGTYKLLYFCDMALDLDTGLNPWWHGDSTLQSDGTNGTKHYPEEGGVRVPAMDLQDVSTIYFVCTSGELMRIECGGL